MRTPSTVNSATRQKREFPPLPIGAKREGRQKRPPKPTHPPLVSNLPPFQTRMVLGLAGFLLSSDFVAWQTSLPLGFPIDPPFTHHCPHPSRLHGRQVF